MGRQLAIQPETADVEQFIKMHLALDRDLRARALRELDRVAVVTHRSRLRDERGILHC